MRWFLLWMTTWQESEIRVGQLFVLGLTQTYNFLSEPEMCYLKISFLTCQRKSNVKFICCNLLSLRKLFVVFVKTNFVSNHPSIFLISTWP